jgi:hypothetical protein
MECKYCGKIFRAKNAIFCSQKCDSYFTKLERKNGLKYNKITVNLNQDIYESLRAIQSNQIQNTHENIFFSEVVNLVLEEGIKIKKMAIKNI